MGRRVEKVAGGVTSSYTYDRSDIIREVRGVTTMKYVHGPVVDEPLAIDDGAALSYFHADGLGSIVKVTSATGSVTLSRQYDAWGNLEGGAGEPGYAFTGREWDRDSGIYHYRARYYDPKTARFVSEDPASYDGGVNLYAYVGGNSPTYFDPFGDKKKRRRYKTPDAAATAGLRLCYPETQYTGWEFCGSICRTDGGWFTFTPPKTDQDSGRCFPDRCPPGTSAAGDFHTHPPPPGGDEDFSFDDKWDVINDPSGNSSYLGSPTGKIRRYDKACRCTSNLPGNLGK